MTKQELSLEWEKRFDRDFYEGLYSVNESDGEYADCYEQVKCFIREELALQQKQSLAVLRKRLTYIKEMLQAHNSVQYTKGEAVEDIDEMLSLLQDKEGEEHE